MKKIVLKLLSIILLLVLSVNIISCDKGSKKDFEKAISLGNENNYTEISIFLSKKCIYTPL